MIRAVHMRGFKRFADVEFSIPGHIVLAGPNNTGKTTLLQAIATWGLALRSWRARNDFNSRRGGYAWAPVSRQKFVSVPLRSFDLLWTNLAHRQRIEIEVRHDAGWRVTMEFRRDSTEQVSVRPGTGAPADLLRGLEPGTVFVPPMTGVGIDEPLYQRPKIEQLLALGRPGEVLRNLLAEANRDEAPWAALCASIDKLFGYELLPPDAEGAHILAEYRERQGGPRLDIASAGSGFQQVLMLLAFLNTRRGAALLLDEPDAHLHVILQDAIYHELRSAAARSGSQLIAATHSEAVINSVEPRELCILLDRPRMAAGDEERNRLISSLRVLSNTDLMQAMGARGVLYVEGYTDMAILRAWAARIGHRADKLLATEIMWKPAAFQTRREGRGSGGFEAREHFDALQLARGDLPGLMLLDGDARKEIADTEITGEGLQRRRWRRYEIESYLLHPDALARFVENAVGAAAGPHVEDMLAWWRDKFPPAVVRAPLGDHVFLDETKARTRLLPPLLEAAGLHGLPYTRYHEIAAAMRPEEIHPEITEKLDDICRAFRVAP